MLTRVVCALLMCMGLSVAFIYISPTKMRLTDAITTLDVALSPINKTKTSVPVIKAHLDTDVVQPLPAEVHLKDIKTLNKQRIVVYFCIPVKSTASMQTLYDTELIKTFLPSLQKSIVLSELSK